MFKAVILIGGPQKGTRFRPLSLEIPKPLFPVAGIPTVQHHIEALTAVPGLREILLVGYYPATQMTQFTTEMATTYKMRIRYLQEYTALGTAGGMYHFRDQIRAGNPDAFFLLNGDVCGDFPLQEMLNFHQSLTVAPPLVTLLGTEATRQQSMMYGCIVEDKETHEVMHYVEKPSTFVSNLVNCGVYICSLDIFQMLQKLHSSKQDFYNEDSMDDSEAIQLELDVIRPLAGTGRAYVYSTDRWWSQIKTAGSAIYANRHYLQLYRRNRRVDRLASTTSPTIMGDVFVHPTATVHPTAVLGPNVSIGKNVTIHAGVRIKESIVLGNATIQEHSCILYSIIGWNSTVGRWSRVEGTPCDPNPNKPFAKMDNVPLFNVDGKLNPSITILGCNVSVPSEVVVLNSIVLPHKDLPRSYKNEIIL